MPATSERLPTDHPLPELLRRHSRILLLGTPGSGKTTLARAAAATLAEEGIVCHCLSADPGLPGFGPPGAACLGVWRDGDWRTSAVAALATLNAARFRLPLVEAVRELGERVGEAPLILDAPGVVRGVAAAELIPGLAKAARIGALLVLVTDDAPAPLAEECRALGLETRRLAPDPRAAHPGPRRRRWRTTAWDEWLEEATEQVVDVSRLAVIGTPPPRHAPSAWQGRQVGLLDGSGRTLALGEIVALEGERLRLRAAPLDESPATLVVRDARRRRDGQLGTALPHAPPARPSSAVGETPARPAGGEEAPSRVRLDILTATLVNGVLGDPLLHVRLKHQKRSLLFDLGDPGRLSARLAHQVTDVFISHAHFDHIGGFMWLLRSRVGDFPACRFYGPPGLAEHLAGQVRGVLWDKVGREAPRFEVNELHGERLERFAIVAGQQGPTPLASREAPGGLLYEELGFRVRATPLEHGVTAPVLAYALEPERQVKVRKEQLEAHGWPPGPWIGELKRRMLAGEGEAWLTLPDGSRHSVAWLAKRLLLTEPGQRLVYATDLGDTAENRRRLVTLSRDAQALFCESPFLASEAEQARRTGHLTATACGEIAAAAGVDRLFPFHFSRRHRDDPEAIRDEIRRHFPRLSPRSAGREAEE